MKNGTTANGGPGKQAEDNAAGTGADKGKLGNKKKSRGGRNYVKKGEGHGGARENSGRHTTEERLEAKGLDILVTKHYGETVKVTITDKRSGITTEVEKPRTLVALEKLFERGTMKDDTQALVKWLEWAIGKPTLPIKHSGEVGTYKAKRPSKAAEAGIEAYERALLAGKGR